LKTTFSIIVRFMIDLFSFCAESIHILSNCQSFVAYEPKQSASIIIFIVLSRYIVSGLTSGAFK